MFNFMYEFYLLVASLSILLFIASVLYLLELSFNARTRGYHIFSGSLAGAYFGMIVLAICAVSVFIGMKLKMTKIEQAALTDFQDAINDKEITCIELDTDIKLERGKLHDEIVISYIDNNKNECTERFYHVPYDKKESIDGQYRVEITDKKAILYIPNEPSLSPQAIWRIRISTLTVFGVIIFAIFAVFNICGVAMDRKFTAMLKEEPESIHNMKRIPLWLKCFVWNRYGRHIKEYSSQIGVVEAVELYIERKETMEGAIDRAKVLPYIIFDKRMLKEEQELAKRKLSAYRCIWAKMKE